MSLMDTPLPSQIQIEKLALTLSKQIDKEMFNKKYASVSTVLKLIGAGAFVAGSIAIPTLPIILKPFIKNENEYELWKRFNIPYLKRTLYRLERQKLVKIKEGKVQTVEITKDGQKRILKYSIEELAIEKPRVWDGLWRMVSYDIPKKLKQQRNIFREYLQLWNFLSIHESMYLHAYHCEKQIEFLREYLAVGKYTRIFIVSKIENDRQFRDFFGV